MKRNPRLLGLMLVGGVMPLPVLADVKFEPYVGAEYEHDDNVFRVDKSDPQGTKSDSIYHYSAGADVKAIVGPQEAYLQGVVQKNDYQDLDLDNTSHKVEGGWNWKVTSAADGQLAASNERRLESFSSRNDGSTDKSLQHDTVAKGSANIRVTPQLELRARAGTERLRNDRDASKDFDRDEQTYAFGLGYLGQPISSVGFEVGYADGKYPQRDAGDPATEAEELAEKFDQVSYLLTALWKPSGISTFDLRAGYTKRDNKGFNGVGGVGGTDPQDFSGATGSLRYVRTISSKTYLTFELFRDVNSSEVVGENFVKRTGAAASFEWHPTSLLTVSAQYRFSRDDYDSDLLLVGESKQRKDKSNVASLSARYEVFRYVFIVPEIDWEKRASNLDEQPNDRDYDDFRAMIGIELRYKR